MQLTSWLVVSLFIVGTSAECLSKGVFCSEDCKSMKRCIGGTEIVIKTCDFESLCNLRDSDCVLPNFLGTCTPKEDLDKLDNSTVICNHNTPMPHPNDCNKYFTCPEKKLMACPEGMSYSIKTRECNNLNTQNCHNSLESCLLSHLGETLPLPQDNNIIQICSYHHGGFQMSLIQCELGNVFSNEQKKCVPKEEMSGS